MIPAIAEHRSVEPPRVIRDPEVFQAHWDPSFGRLQPTQPTTWQKVRQVAWNVFSVIVFPVGLIRFGIYKLKQTDSFQAIQQRALQTLLPARTLTPEEITYWQGTFLNDFLPDPRLRHYPFTVHSHSIATPDGKATVEATFFKHRDAQPDTPTIVYFNPNGALSCMTPYDTVLDALVDRDIPFNFVAFDYRSTGKSTGTLDSFDDLVTDSASVIQWVKEKIGTPANKILFHGWSLGGAVATEVKALNPKLTPGDFCNERSLSSSDDMIDAYLPRIHPILGNCLVKFCVKKLSRVIFQPFDVVPAFLSLQGRELVVYHHDDPVIPYAASLARRLYQLASPLEMTTLWYVPLTNKDLPEYVNHHNHPLHQYRNAITRDPALETIARFLLPRPIEQLMYRMDGLERHQRRIEAKIPRWWV